MVESLGTLLAGLLSIFAVSGVGRLLIRPLGLLPAHWYVALSMLAGFAACSVFVQAIALTGSSILSFSHAVVILVVIGGVGHLAAARWLARVPFPKRGPILAAACVVLIVSFSMLLLISVAPSTKIDELYYHMLMGRRVLEDGGLRIYQLPFEQAILPQMGYQVFETLFHAFGVIDGGNVLSLAFFVALVFLVYGVVTEESASPNAGLMAAVAASSGLFPAIWYVTSGPHALGDLATFTSVAALIFPGRLVTEEHGDAESALRFDRRRAFACIMGAACAASTKISLVPLGLLISGLAVVQAPGRSKLSVALIAFAIWIFVLGPLISWTYAQTHSPFGLAFADWFSGSIYQSVALEQLAATRVASQQENPLPYILEMLNGLSIALVLFGAWTCARDWRTCGILLILLTVQIGLIAVLLPYDFRFLGGLQHALLAAGAIGVAPKWQSSPKVEALALMAVGPWLAASVYYAWPFAMVSLGVTPRHVFKERYVAFSRDFDALALRLPKDAVLYAPNERPPSVYASRPMIFDLADWNGRSPLFKFKVGDYAEAPAAVAHQRSLHLICRAVVYRNSAATVATYRTPGQQSERFSLSVRQCLKQIASN